MKLQIKHLSLQNFAGLPSLEADFGDVTEVTGRNGCGKSTVRNAILWVLTDKMADGRPADDIRPRGSDGKASNYNDVVATLTVDISGRGEVALSKTQRAKMAKKRGEQEATFDGNTVLYAVNGVEKSAKEYAQWVAENIADSGKTALCISPAAFFNLDQKKRREALMSAVKLDDGEMLASGEFDAIKDILKDGTVDQLSLAQKRDIKAAQGESDKKLAAIQELESQKSSEDLEALSVEKAKLEKELADLISDGGAEIDRLKKEESRLAAEQARIEEEAESERAMDYNALNAAYTGAVKRRANISTEIAEYEAKLESVKSRLEQRKTEMGSIRKEYADEKASEYAGNGLCPACGRPLPQEALDGYREKFEKDRAGRMAEIIERGRKCKYDIDIFAQSVKDMTEKLEKLQEASQEARKRSEDAERARDSLPEVEPGKIPEWADAWQKRLKIRNRIAKLAQNPKNDEKASSCKAALEAVSKRIAIAENDKALDERISELRGEQREIAQKAADAQKKLDLLSAYSKRRNALIENEVNKEFEGVKFSLFKYVQTTGEYAECCEITVKGVSYDSMLNYSDKLLAEAAIVQGFQKAYGLMVPIFIDNTESIDSDRLPKTEVQEIIIRRTDDERLTLTGRSKDEL